MRRRQIDFRLAKHLPQPLGLLFQLVPFKKLEKILVPFMEVDSQGVLEFT